MIEEEKKEFGLWWLWVLGLIIISIIGLSLLNYFGKIGSTIVERKVFENSYQRSEGLRSQENTWNAQLSSISSQLMRAEPGTSIYNQLMAQKAMLEMQITQTKGMK